MAKVVIEENAVDIRFSLLERVVLAERSRKVPLSRIRSVDPHPPLLDLMVHWSDQSGSWLCGVSSYDGHMVPSARHPGSTLAIELEGDEPERIYIEVDDESPTAAASRIERAVTEAPIENSPYVRMPSTPPPAPDEPLHQAPGVASMASVMPSESRAEREARKAALLEALDVELDEEEIRHRDPLMQGSLPPAPMPHAEAAPELEFAGDRDLSRLGSWLLGIGSLALLSGGVMIATGALPGLLAVGAGVAAALLGGVALAVVARHQG